jgi:hypothetical protein
MLDFRQQEIPLLLEKEDKKSNHLIAERYPQLCPLYFRVLVPERRFSRANLVDTI